MATPTLFPVSTGPIPSTLKRKGEAPDGSNKRQTDPGSIATVPQLLTLAKRIAEKARQLIPRSANRICYGAPSAGGFALDSEWVEAKQYIVLQLRAMRARKSASTWRELVVDLQRQASTDLRMQDEISEELQQAFFEVTATAESVDLAELERKLDKAKHSRANKVRHKDNRPFLEQERQEAEAKNAVIYGVGNCGECAALALTMFAEYPGPEGDESLPGAGAHTVVEKIAATRGDHAFVVVNRNKAIDIQQPASWMTNQMIICDPWWFHTGHAILGSERTAGDTADLVTFIMDNADNLTVDLELILGQGHTTRFDRSSKTRGLSYYKDSVADVKHHLGAA